eukprot:CAMPEP_0118844756 /NCGR_PEP_ID=MMETSP1162-20130426/86939_1 /TAXON_ID=33656 /ORGANISM="Phaeocystis Sp, Strain CCMP2710" /LENGTH=94 /DNA_ID=CAMNT_0006776887 /DNA_START=28 /DNA_END=311 /DNA_ORIENTATION=-
MRMGDSVALARPHAHQRATSHMLRGVIQDRWCTHDGVKWASAAAAAARGSSQLQHRDVIARQVPEEELAVRLGGRTDAGHDAPVQVVQRLDGAP